MRFPTLDYIRWAKSLPKVEINLARSGIDACPPKLLGLKASDLVTTLPVKYGYEPLREAIAARYKVDRRQVFPLSGGTTARSRRSDARNVSTRARFASRIRCARASMAR